MRVSSKCLCIHTICVVCANQQTYKLLPSYPQKVLLVSQGSRQTQTPWCDSSNVLFVVQLFRTVGQTLLPPSFLARSDRLPNTQDGRDKQLGVGADLPRVSTHPSCQTDCVNNILHLPSTSRVVVSRVKCMARRCDFVTHRAVGYSEHAIVPTTIIAFYFGVRRRMKVVKCVHSLVIII